MMRVAFKVVMPAVFGLVALLAIGCPKSGTDAGTDTGTGGTDSGVDPALYGPVDLNVSCPAAPAEVGNPSGFGVDQTQFTWHYSADDEVSWAPILYYGIPADIVSFAVTIDHSDFDTGLAVLELAGTTHIDFTALDDTGWGGSPFYHFPVPAGTVVLPMDDLSDPVPGCLAIVPVVDSFDVAGETGTAYVVSRRGGPAMDILDLNMIMVTGAGITTTEVDAAVVIIDALYSAAGIGTIGNVTYVTAGGSPLVDSEGADINALRATDPGGDPWRMNIFFIQDFSDEPGTLGIAAGIPGPLGVHGTVGSGMVVSVDSHLDVSFAVDTTLLGETIAHELAHQMGLFHTTEPDGLDHDFLSDTPECTPAQDTDMDGYVSAEECDLFDGHNLMFWVSSDMFSQDEMSVIQAQVINRSPVIR